MADWVFLQIEGPLGSRKQLTLSGWSAPFGRPRREPVIKETIKSRVQTTRYPGASGKQTRHAFGTNLEPTELKGRWMTKANVELAGDIADQWAAFVRDERTCRISWGNIVSWTGFIDELELGRESEHEIAWRMKILLDERDDVKRAAPRALTYSSIDDLAAKLTTWIASSKKLKAPVENDLTPDFLDSLNNLAADLNQPAALLNKLAGEFSDTEKRTTSALQHFRGAVANVREALLTIRETVVNAQVDAVTLARTAESDIAWVKYQSDLDIETLLALNILADLDRRAELADKGEPAKFVVAREGDTWESISTRATGSPEKAGAIRTLNGARYGERPVINTSYLVQ